MDVLKLFKVFIWCLYLCFSFEGTAQPIGSSFNEFLEDTYFGTDTSDLKVMAKGFYYGDYSDVEELNSYDNIEWNCPQQTFVYSEIYAHYWNTDSNGTYMIGSYEGGGLGTAVLFPIGGSRAILMLYQPDLCELCLTAYLLKKV